MVRNEAMTSHTTVRRHPWSTRLRIIGEGMYHAGRSSSPSAPTSHTDTASSSTAASGSAARARAVNSSSVSTSGGYVVSTVTFQPYCHAGSKRARSEHAELIALRIGEHDPRMVALSQVRPRRAECKQPLDFDVSVVWPEVEVQAILDRLRLRDGGEEEPRQTIRGGSNLELVGVVADDDPTERLPPPPSEAARIACIDDRLLPLEAHDSIVETQRGPSGSVGARR